MRFINKNIGAAFNEAVPITFIKNIYAGTNSTEKQWERIS